MRKQVYDTPTRIFHWLFAGFFLTAFGITKIVDSESLVFSYHMLIGLTLFSLVLTRIVWGLIGSKHARFSGFALNPKDLFTYFNGILSGDKKRWAGHNPASSWAALLMIALSLGLGVTGFLMSTGQKETFEDIHELFANAFIITAILHVLGIILHTIRHKEMIGLSMINGKKENIIEGEQIHSNHNLFGVILLSIVAIVGFTVFKKFNPETRTLTFGNTTLQLGEENENQEGSKSESPSMNSIENENEHDDQD